MLCQLANFMLSKNKSLVSGSALLLRAQKHRLKQNSKKTRGKTRQLLKQVRSCFERDAFTTTARMKRDNKDSVTHMRPCTAPTLFDKG
jgi:hypothetical protein